MAGTVIRVVSMCLSAVLASGVVTAAGLQDPTRPPDGIYDAGSVEGATTNFGPQLQMVVTGAGVASRALISGEWVKQGDVYGAFRVADIAPDWVILKSPSGREKLRLTPQVQVSNATTGVPSNAKKNKRQVSGSAEAAENMSRSTR